MFFQIICRTEVKSLHLILPCALLGQFDETRMISEKNFKSVQYCEESAMGRLLQALECCYFDRGTKIILRKIFGRNDLIEKFICTRHVLIDNNAHISLYIAFNS